MIDVLMPQLGESVAEGTVTKWLVREGDLVKREQPLLEVATDKADSEIPAPVAGRVAQIAVREGTVVATRGLLCRLDPVGPQAAPDPIVGPVKLHASAPADGGAPAVPLSTPSTRKIARELGVDLGGVHPTGERGRVTREDVLRAAAPNDAPHARAAPAPREASAAATELSHLIQAGGGFVPPIPGLGYGAYKVPPYVQRPGDEVVPFSRRRRITADHMVYSKLVSPHVVTVAEVDLQATSKLRDQHKDAYKKSGVPLTFLAFVAAATVKALREHPQMNARVLDSSYAVLRDINLGVAVDTPGGLIVPSIKHADQLSLRGIASTIDEVATRARTGKTTADDLANTTFSVSNPGLKGNLFGGAIIAQPNVGILRMGEIKKRVVVVSAGGEDAMAIHPVMYLALSYDHRVIDGVLANAFLWRVADLLDRAEFEP